MLTAVMRERQFLLGVSEGLKPVGIGAAAGAGPAGNIHAWWVGRGVNWAPSCGHSLFLEIFGLLKAGC